VSAANAMQPESTAELSQQRGLGWVRRWRQLECQQPRLCNPWQQLGEAGLDGKVEAAGAEEVEEEDLPPVQHKAWEAKRLRALNEVLSVELQPEELLLEAVEAPWKEVSNEESSDGKMEVGSSLQPGGLAPKRMRDVASGQDGRGKKQQN
jgi:hypothetical protein